MAAGCKDEAAPAKTPPSADAGAPASAGGKRGDAAAAAAAAASGPDKATMCASRCLLLTRYSLAELEGGRHEKECGVPLMRGTGCDQLDAMRNCIYAAHGYRFEKKRWRDKFAATSWYHPDPSFDETKLSRLETANIRALRDRATKCKSKGRIAVSAADAGLVRDWFAKKKAGKLRLPTRLLVDDQPADKKYFLHFIHRPGLFVLEPYTPMSYRENAPGARGLRGKKVRTISAATGVPPPGCVDVDQNGGCEGFDILELTFSGNKLVALNAMTAACPFVYAAGNGGALAFEGEILRSLRRPEDEATEDLALDASAGCAATIRVRLAEEKPEVSYLDAAWLAVGDRRIAPRRCDRGAAAECADDGRYRRIEPGQHLDLRFDLPESLRCRPRRLVADGYYQPL